jgi:Zn-dependent M32 family carboxypeptidase
MSSEYGSKSLAELKAQARKQTQEAETAIPCVNLTESNWTALISLQKTQIILLEQISESLKTLTTREELADYMNRQLEILTRDTEQYQDTLTELTQQVTEQWKQTSKEMEKQAGSMSGYFSQRLSEARAEMDSHTKMLFRISMIPSLILLLLELVPHIWQLVLL